MARARRPVLVRNPADGLEHVMTNAQGLSGEEFLQQLERDEIVVPIVLIGMVKKPENGSDHLLFTRGPACANWTKVPVGSIESVGVLARVRCKDHNHALVRLQLRPPQTEEGQLFAALLQDRRAGPAIRRPLPMSFVKPQPPRVKVSGVLNPDQSAPDPQPPLPTPVPEPNPGPPPPDAECHWDWGQFLDGYGDLVEEPVLHCPGYGTFQIFELP